MPDILVDPVLEPLTGGAGGERQDHGEDEASVDHLGMIYRRFPLIHSIFDRTAPFILTFAILHPFSQLL